MHSQKSVTSISKDSSYTTIDTTKSSAKDTEVKTILFGDTLTGSITFPEFTDTDFVYESHVDSIESSGIKVTVNLTKNRNGSPKIGIKAVAKPNQVIETKTKETAKENGNSSTGNTTITAKTDIKDKESDTISWWWIIPILIVIAACYWAYKKYL